MNPLISIIVPVHNVGPYLGACLDSIIAQQFQDFEVILINDGSTDQSGDICCEYERKDHRVKAFHQPYFGVSAARNRGIQLAKGDYIGFVDSDDRIDPQMYQELYGLCSNTKSEIGICQLGREIEGVLINKPSDERIVKEMNRLEAMRELFKGNLYRFSLCNKLFHRTCFEGITFPEGRIHEDLATTYKLFAHAEKAVYTNFIGYHYIKRENSILTSTYDHKRLDAFLGWDEILPFMTQFFPSLTNEVFSSFGYWCVDNIYYVLTQIENKQQRNDFIEKIKVRIDSYYWDLRNNPILSMKYKSILSIVRYQARLLFFFHAIKNPFHWNKRIS